MMRVGTLDQFRPKHKEAPTSLKSIALTIRENKRFTPMECFALTLIVLALSGCIMYAYFYPDSTVLQNVGGQPTNDIADLTLSHIGRGTWWAWRKDAASFLRPLAIGVLAVLLVAVLVALSSPPPFGTAGEIRTSGGAAAPQPEVSGGMWKSVTDALSKIGSLVAGVAFTFGFFQWKAARQEASFERYYDRLELANTRFDDWKKTKLKVTDLKRDEDDGESEKHSFSMFMFSELDNLEYVLQKHWQRYIHRDLVSRAIRHFWARCTDEDDGEEFRSTIISWFGENAEKGFAGYQKDTQMAVTLLAKCGRQQASSTGPH